MAKSNWAERVEGFHVWFGPRTNWYIRSIYLGVTINVLLYGAVAYQVSRDLPCGSDKCFRLPLDNTFYWLAALSVVVCALTAIFIQHEKTTIKWITRAMVSGIPALMTIRALNAVLTLTGQS
ncbi:hypothetical protein MNBD_ALPHA08-2068 [hydrothermal vent metagenome]|uniref:Uncharacterized protein n=1 Tax=hydrothermal vent metagenome TaxID=652676 RepID=A0A3B0RYK8_9ZZZZ